MTPGMLLILFYLFWPWPKHPVMPVWEPLYHGTYLMEFVVGLGWLLGWIIGEEWGA